MMWIFNQFQTHLCELGIDGIAIIVKIDPVLKEFGQVLSHENQHNIFHFRWMIPTDSDGRTKDKYFFITCHLVF